MVPVAKLCNALAIEVIMAQIAVRDRVLQGEHGLGKHPLLTVSIQLKRNARMRGGATVAVGFASVIVDLKAENVNAWGVPKIAMVMAFAFPSEMQRR